jgi:hypothetical protein
MTAEARAGCRLARGACGAGIAAPCLFPGWMHRETGEYPNPGGE